MRSVTSRERGQASVELVALLPLAAALALGLWQVAVAGYAQWAAGGAVRAAARAAAVGGDPLAAARRALPGALEHGLSLARTRDGGVRLGVVVPAVVGGGRLWTVHEAARLAPQGR